MCELWYGLNKRGQNIADFEANRCIVGELFGAKTFHRRRCTSSPCPISRICLTSATGSRLLKRESLNPHDPWEESLETRAILPKQNCLLAVSTV